MRQQIPLNRTIDLGPPKLMDPSENVPPRPFLYSTVQVHGACPSTRTRRIHFLGVMNENSAIMAAGDETSQVVCVETSRLISTWEPELCSLGQAFEIEFP